MAHASAAMGIWIISFRANMGRPRESVEHRLLKYMRVDAATNCWVWIGALSEGGYARLCVNNRDTRAHRAAYELFVGPVPDGLQIDHLCRVRNCINPAHLEAVTGSENCRRGTVGDHIADRQRAKTHCPRGHEYSGENLAFWKNSGRVGRKCRACESARGKRRHAAKKAALVGGYGHKDEA